MVSPAEHEAWATHNEEFARWLKGKWPQWIVTALFYAALHYVDGYLRGDAGWNPGKDRENHGARNDLLRRQFRDLARPYLRLYQYSQEARYQCRKHDDKIVKRAFEALKQVKAEIESLRDSPAT